MSDTLAADVEREQLDLLLRGFQVSRMLRLVADLGVADKIPAGGHVTVQDLAAACAVLPEPMLRVLRALAAFRIFRVTAEGAIGHTPYSRLLRTDTPNSMHHAARFWTGPGSWSAWGMLDVAMTRWHTARGGLEHGPLRLFAPAPGRSARLRCNDGELPRQPAYCRCRGL